MDFNAIIDSAVEFSSAGIGALLRDIAIVLYNVFYPSNADAATPFEIPA